MKILQSRVSRLWAASILLYFFADVFGELYRNFYFKEIKDLEKMILSGFPSFIL